MGLEEVKKIILVLSGKGGVGKSSVSTQTALGLLEKGLTVGLLDVDLCGPSIPRMIGIEGEEVHKSDGGLVPVLLENDKLKVMSLGLLTEKDDAVVWRGPKKQSTIDQLVNDVNWGELDVLVIDTPPGTSDEHIALVKNFRSDSSLMERTTSILVTTPQRASLQDVAREINFCKKTGIHITGLVENMSGFVCPNCDECSNIFNAGGGEVLAKKYELNFLGRIPIDPNFGHELDNGRKFSQAFKDSNTAKSIQSIVKLMPV